MDTPSKPWEVSRGQTPTPNYFGNLRSSSENEENRKAPPVPPRPLQQRATSPLYRSNIGGMGYSPYSGSYGMGGGYGMYGGGGPYYGGGGGMYGSSYRGFGSSGGFTQQAEDNTRQAFQSVESIVRAFTSVSTMLESTLGAVYSSFRAVLDVADHFSRVKATFTDVLSSIAVFRFLRFLYRRTLALLRLDTCDEAWESTAPNSLAKPKSPMQKKSWPIMLFVAVVIGGPYLIWRLLRGGSQQKQSVASWMNGDGDHVIAKAEFDFQGASSDELTFQAGDKIILAPRDLQPNIRGWLLGTMDGKTPGHLPSNYVKILGLKKGRQPSPPPAPDAQVNDVKAEAEWNIHADAASSVENG